MKLVIAETETSTWNYHLREVVDEKYWFGGGAPPALCGAKLGWDTKIPLMSWLSKDGMSKYCAKCEKLALAGVSTTQEVTK